MLIIEETRSNGMSDDYKSMSLEELIIEKGKLEKDIKRYHAAQYSVKVLINSLYGSLLNEFCRWYSVDNGEAITLSGQLIINYAIIMINKLLNDEFGTKDIDYCVFSDTDSMGVCLQKYAETLSETDEQIITDRIDEFCKNKIQPYLEKIFKEFVEISNGYAQKLYMKREKICLRGIWTNKKRYVVHIMDDEGIRHKVPELKVVGLEAVRSSTPAACKAALLKAYDYLLKEDKKGIIAFIDDFENKFSSLEFEGIAKISSVNDIDKYYDEKTTYKLHCPQHVKGALLFNVLIKKYNLENIAPIGNGDKIRYFPLLQPNPINDSVIAFSERIPQELEFLKKYFDYNTQFEKMVKAPIESMAFTLGWNLSVRNTLESFFG